MKAANYKGFLFLLGAAILCAAFLLFRSAGSGDEVLYGSIRSMEPLADGLQVDYVLGNRSEGAVRLSGDRVLEVKVNGVPRDFVTEDFELAPGEEKSFTLLLTGVDLDRSVQVEISSRSEGGGSVSMRKTFNPLYDG